MVENGLKEGNGGGIRKIGEQENSFEFDEYMSKKRSQTLAQGNYHSSAEQINRNRKKSLNKNRERL
jgi:hypothetical protein